ncbi:MAG: sigma-70 family RNA polymerase sigma factor [Candidatus Omnitrophica bacterium]|nr:sigma-70 family RNA polymerase sigma factor [Candidatus Omnitrophota bacterium]
MEKKLDREAIKREKQLVARCVKESKGAWEEFVDAYKGLIYNSIIRTFHFVGYKNTEEIADDLFQDVFALLLKNRCAKLGSFKWKNDCSLVYWLGVITKNLTFDYIRKFISRENILTSMAKDPGSEHVLLDEEESPDMSFLGKIEEKERLEIFGQALERLSKDELRLVELLYFRGLAHERTADILGKSVDAVYMQKKRVIEKLKAIVKKILKPKRIFEA